MIPDLSICRNTSKPPLRPGLLGITAAWTAVLWLTSCQLLIPPDLPAVDSPSPLPIITLVPIPTAPPPSQDPPQEQILKFAPPEQETVGLFDLVELEIQTDLTQVNPFDPDECEILVEFTSPSGNLTRISAFWYQEYEYQPSSTIGDPGWRVRFTPAEIGTWTAVALVPPLGLESAPVQFAVTPSSHPGFVRVNPANPRYFSRDDGNFFFPIGVNMAWWSGAGDALTDYQRWMDLFAANGGNTIRVWMADWSFGIEGENTPLGDYSRRLQRAWLLDQIFQMAEERGIYIILVLYNCADFNNWQTNGWARNPYNARNGGPLEEPENFVTDPTARGLTQQRIHYIVNRWGYSPQLLAWEWWNEVNLAPFSDETLIPWLQEMTAYLRERDVNQHLVTNSYAIRDLSPIWSLPELDIIQKHEYANQIDSSTKDLSERAAADFARLSASTPPKPVLLGEFGYGSEGVEKEIDQSGIHLHNGIWATTFVGYAGSGMYWYWDIYLEQYRNWGHFRGLERFLRQTDLSEYIPFSPLQISGPVGQPADALGLGLRGKDILVWIRSNAYTVQACESEWALAGKPAVYRCSPPLVEGQVLTLRDLPEGEYVISWYHPQIGTWMDPLTLATDGDQLRIDIPGFRRDLAARIALAGD